MIKRILVPTVSHITNLTLTSFIFIDDTAAKQPIKEMYHHGNTIKKYELLPTRSAHLITIFLSADLSYMVQYIINLVNTISSL